MAQADGSVLVKVNLDASEADKDLAKLKKKIADTEETVADTQKARDAAHQKELFSAAELDAEKMKLEEIKNRLQEIRALSKDKSVGAADREQYAGMLPGVKDELANQQARVQGLQAEYNKVAAAVERYNSKLQEGRSNLDRMKKDAGELTQKINRVGKASGKMTDYMAKADKALGRFGRRMGSVVAGALVFNVVSAGMRRFVEWGGKVIQSNDEAQTAIAKLKGALLTLAQPLVDVLIPAFTAFVEILTEAAAAAADLVSKLFGKTAEQSAEAAKSLNAEIEALEGTGDAAKKAGKSMASFDEINQLSGGGAVQGISGGAETKKENKVKITTDFNFGAINQELLDRILSVAKMIGAVIIGWKLSDSFLGTIKKSVGAFMALDAAINLAKTTWDAWQNGVDGDTLPGMLGRILELCIGLFLLFGKVGAAIGLVVGGLVMLVTAFQDAEKNGWNLHNMLLAMSGIFAAGAGVAIFIGSWIPLLVAAIASAMLAITASFGDGEKLINDFELTFQGMVDFVSGAVTGDLDKAISGAGDIFDGLRGIVSNIFTSIKNMVGSFFDWLDEKTGGQFTLTITWISDTLQSSIQWLADKCGSLLSGLKQMLQGVVEFIGGVFSGDWDRAFQGLVEIVKGAVNVVTSLIESVVNLFINGVNTMIRALNTISFTAPDWAGGETIGINIPLVPKFKIPKLAQGAVIPPNREFMAVLGDQKSGTNIETPLETMVQAFRQAMSETGGGGRDITIVLEMDRREFGRAVYRANNEETQRVGTRLAVVKA